MLRNTTYTALCICQDLFQLLHSFETSCIKRDNSFCELDSSVIVVIL